MRKLVTWVAVTLGIAALLRRLRRRSSEPGPAQEPPPGDPARELREKLAATRAPHGAADATDAPATVEERRAEVHAEGRAALEEMRGAGDDA